MGQWALCESCVIHSVLCAPLSRSSSRCTGLAFPPRARGLATFLSLPRRGTLHFFFVASAYPLIMSRPLSSSMWYYTPIDRLECARRIVKRKIGIYDTHLFREVLFLRFIRFLESQCPLKIFVSFRSASLRHALVSQKLFFYNTFHKFLQIYNSCMLIIYLFRRVNNSSIDFDGFDRKLSRIIYNLIWHVTINVYLQRTSLDFT